MKKLLFFFSLMLMMATSLSGQTVKDELGVTKLKFNDTKYELGYSYHKSNTYLQEYLPKGQTFEKYEDMFSIYVNTAPSQTPEMAVRSKEAELAKRKEFNKDVWNWAIFNSDDSTKYMIDFICCESKDGTLKMIEFDVHKYSMIEAGGHPALLLIFYSHRVYGDDILPFMNNELADFRIKAIRAISKYEVECNKLNKK